MTYSVVKVFTATKARDRDDIGMWATEWLREHPDLRVVGKRVCLSSDNEFHCLSLVLFCSRVKRARRAACAASP